MQRKGTLFVVSAPSGTGKTTLVKTLVTRVPGLEVSRSYTSRQPRPGERDGVEYHFVSRKCFESMRESGEFLEWAELFGNLYGTSASDTQRRLDLGLDLILVIDVQGASQIRQIEHGSVGVFVLPPSPAVLEKRLRQRNLEHLKNDELERRLAVARSEVDRISDYDYVIINREIEHSVEQLRSIVMAERLSWRVAGSAGESIAQAFRAVS